MNPQAQAALSTHPHHPPTQSVPAASSVKVDPQLSESPTPTTPDQVAQPKQNGLSHAATKKKKAARACFHCQKAHLTCDDSRPCQRCLKRNIADSCVEGIRKKAKYLLDDDELERLKAEKAQKQLAQSLPTGPASMGCVTFSSFTAPEAALTPIPSTSTAPLASPTEIPAPPVPTPSQSFQFGSEGANLEYSMIEALLGPLAQGGQEYSASTPQLWQQQSPTNLQSSQSFPQPPPATVPPHLTNGFPYPNQQHPPPFPASTVQHPSHSFNPSPSSNTTVSLSNAEASPFSAPTASTSFTTPGLTTFNDLYPPRVNPSEVYLRTTVPYDYTAGYHFLMKYLQNGRFAKNEILRVARALAIFRPSLIALQMPLSHDDEVFVEKCFQRSMIELDKLISMSGTPTAVWRRTGEICLVGLEFSLLTEWPHQELMTGRKYIYELFENQSTIEYWENFANHAFENTTQSVHTHCVLVKPSGQRIPCTFCFSIRRDLFDLPTMVANIMTHGHILVGYYNIRPSSCGLCYPLCTCSFGKGDPLPFETTIDDFV